VAEQRRVGRRDGGGHGAEKAAQSEDVACETPEHRRPQCWVKGVKEDERAWQAQKHNDERVAERAKTDPGETEDRYTEVAIAIG
jgi:hypothetical protein